MEQRSPEFSAASRWWLAVLEDRFLDQPTSLQVLTLSEFRRNMDQYDEFNRLPVTVLSGFLGAGKTTLLNHVPTNHNALLRRPSSRISVEVSS